MKNLEKMNLEAIVAELLNGQININDLDLHKSVQREAFKSVIFKRPNLLKEIKKENGEHFIKYALEIDPRYFVYLNREQYTDEFAQVYIAKRFEELEKRVSAESKQLPVVIQKSLDGKMVFNYSYATEEGGELYYLDSELMVPVSIKSSFKISVKLVNAVMLIDKLDTHITQLGANTIYTAITDVIVSSYKCYLNSYIKDNKVGYYTLCTSFEEIGKGFTKKLNDRLDQYGIVVSDFKLSSLAIPKDIQYKLEDQAFALRQRKADVEADAEMAKISLESYEAKLAVQQKYPDADHSLTEYEKDLALKRYLIKSERYETAALDHDIDINRKNVVADSQISKKSDVVPEIAPKSGGNGALTAAVVAGLLMTTIGFATGTVAMGIVFMLATIAASVAIVVVKNNNKKAIKTEPNVVVGDNASEDSSQETSKEISAETASVDGSTSVESTEQ